MISPEILVLCGTAATIAFVHTLPGPDHYLPFVALAKSRQWSSGKALRTTLFCGAGHIVGSVVLGFVGIYASIQLGALEWIEGWRGDIAAWAVVSFGLVAAKSGRVGLPGCYHMHPEVVADAVAQYPNRFFGLVGIDPYTGMDGVRALEYAVSELGFIGAHLYPHWFELPANHAKYYPFYAKCIELDIPVQMQVGQSLIYSREQRCRSVGRPIYLDDIACDLPELKLIGSQVGIPWHEEMIAMAWKHDSIYIATDAHSPKYWPETVVKYLNSYGQNKVIYGTDFPVLRFERTVQEIDELGLKPEVRRKFMHENAIRIYGLEGKIPCQILGELGADVIKIEPPGGDTNRDLEPHRNHSDMCSMYLGCNRNKRSVALDLKSGRGRQAALDIMKSADVVVHNFRPQAMARLGLDYQAVNPEVIHCATCGYSKTKPYGEKGALDDSIQAASGAAALAQKVLGEPRYMPTIIADKTTAMFVVQSVLAALFHKSAPERARKSRCPCTYPWSASS